MGKQKKQKKANKPTVNDMPFVSVCTPTFNRRPFIKQMFRCFLSQDYPKSRLEWIIIDDGTDKIEDLINEANIPQIKYFKYDEQMVLGKKRNLMHEKSKGNIIVYMDDDDYYPSDRISHAVEKLRGSDALCAGSSIIHVYFKHIKTVIEFGPYGPNHATAGTFAFKRSLLEQTSYDDNAALAEEKHFLKNYTIPFVQLDPMKTILVFSHNHNTFDKKKLLDNPNPQFCKHTKLKVSTIVRENDSYEFFMNHVDHLLDKYKPGLPEMKPLVLKQTKQLHEQRIKQMEEANKQQQQQIIMETPEGKRVLQNNEIVDVLQKLDSELKNKINDLETKNKRIEQLQQENAVLKNEIDSLKNELNLS
jgi:glycosyltransferase involved in cell wall biosynthesis